MRVCQKNKSGLTEVRICTEKPGTDLNIAQGLGKMEHLLFVEIVIMDKEVWNLKLMRFEHS